MRIRVITSAASILLLIGCFFLKGCTSDESENEIQPPPTSMVLIPAGEFTMGTDPANKLFIKYGWEADWFSDEMPQRKIFLDAYYIDKHEVTVAEYQKFIEAGGYQKKDYWTEEGWRFINTTNRTEPWYWGTDEIWKDFNAPGQPVVGVTLYEAMAYAKWAQKRLPTEAEWEKAARGTDGRLWPWGNEWDVKKVNSWESGLHKPTPVGKYPKGASPYGIMDVAGNVWEWCADRYDPEYYSHIALVNPKSEIGETYTLRGGAWNGNAAVVRCAVRYSYAPTSAHYAVGFRCAKSPEDKEAPLWQVGKRTYPSALFP